MEKQQKINVLKGLSMQPDHRGTKKPVDNYEKWDLFFKSMDQSWPLFSYFRLFFMTQIKYKLIKALMEWSGTRTRGGRMEGVEESTELWRHALNGICLLFVLEGWSMGRA